MADPLRARLLGWARSQNGWIIEDDRDSDMWFHDVAPPRPLAAEDSERVLLIGSFNRILFPGLCVAFLVAPLGLVERLRGVHAMIGGRASLASQLALREFIGEGHFARHLRRRRQAYAERRAILLDCLRDHEAVEADALTSKAGLHVVLDVGAGRAPAVAALLAAARLGGAALDAFAVGAQPGAHLLLGLGATPEVVRAEAPRVAAAILHDNPDFRDLR
jgi:GntR family transcriptional regulator/MocR family aminotransferase